VKLCKEQLSIPNGTSSKQIQVPVPEVGTILSYANMMNNPL